MSDEKRRKDEGEAEKKKEGAGDLGKLPPLSDFESSEGRDLDSGLPPLGSLGSEGEEEPFSGLPPISDIPVETPMPTGGAIKPSPPGFEETPRVPLDTPDFATPTGGSAFETPSPEPGTGFQDLAADSDFTPETPEIGVGGESDLETPMFDSTFGAGDSGLGPTPETTAPTRAMETPVFGERGARREEGVGFDADAFREFEGGTPVPDFTPDTAAPTQPTTPTPAVTARPAAAAARGKKGMGVKGVLVGIILLIVGLAVGVLLGPMVSHDYITNLPMNPWKADLDNAQRDISDLRSQNSGLQVELTKFVELQDLYEQGVVSTQRLAELRTQTEAAMSELARVEVDLNTARGQLAEIVREVNAKNEEYVQTEQEYENLLNQISIMEARRDGLDAEIDRLQSQVGQLEVADNRRMQTKAALEHAVDLLAITIQEGLPLTPAKHSRQDRIAAVERLRANVTAANWVDPDLLRDYTSLYLDELAIADAREYFFAKIPVTDRFGTDSMVWAECVMNGNWSVYYRTIDGKHIGVYQNTAKEGAPRYEFVESIPASLRNEVDGTIMAMRPEGFEEQLQMLVQKQEVGASKTPLQRVYDSL